MTQHNDLCKVGCRIRHGKTARDHASGSHAATKNNNVARANWHNDTSIRERSRAGNEVASPPHSGGKGNSAKARKF